MMCYILRLNMKVFLVTVIEVCFCFSVNASSIYCIEKLNK